MEELTIEDWSKVNKLQIFPTNNNRAKKINFHKIINSLGICNEIDVLLTYEETRDLLLLRVSYEGIDIEEIIDKNEFEYRLRENYLKHKFISEIEWFSNIILEMKEKLIRKSILLGKPILSNTLYEFNEAYGIIENNGKAVAKSIGIELNLGEYSFNLHNIIGTNFDHGKISIQYFIPKINLTIYLKGINLIRSSPNGFTGIFTSILLEQSDKSINITTWPEFKAKNPSNLPSLQKRLNKVIEYDETNSLLNSISQPVMSYSDNIATRLQIIGGKK